MAAPRQYKRDAQGRFGSGGRVSHDKSQNDKQKKTGRDDVLHPYDKGRKIDERFNIHYDNPVAEALNRFDNKFLGGENMRRITAERYEGARYGKHDGMRLGRRDDLLNRYSDIRRRSGKGKFSGKGSNPGPGRFK